MNIVMVSYWSCPLTKLGVLASGGMNVYLLNLADNLGQLGHKVDIYTRTHKENDEKIVAIHPNVRIIHLSSTSEDLYQDTRIYSKKLLDYIKKNRLSYDIIHTHYYSGLIGLQLKKQLGLPLIHTFHTLGSIKARYAGVKDQQRIRTEIEITSQTTAMIVSTDYEKQELINDYQAFEKKFFVISPGVNHHLFKKHKQKNSRIKLHLPQEQQIILFVGRIDPIKGINFLISAVALFNQRYSDMKNKLQVVLIGGDIESRHFWENKEVKKIVKLIKEKNLQCCVKFIGSRPHYLLPYYYSAADLVLMPSIYESFGFVVLEAMACGSVVIASKVGGHNYLIRDKINGRLFDSGDINQLCQIIYDLLNQKIERVKLGRQALLNSQKFCWDKQAKRFISVYKKYL